MMGTPGQLSLSARQSDDTLSSLNRAEPGPIPSLQSSTQNTSFQVIDNPPAVFLSILLDDELNNSENSIFFQSCNLIFIFRACLKTSKENSLKSTV